MWECQIGGSASIELQHPPSERVKESPGTADVPNPLPDAKNLPTPSCPDSDHKGRALCPKELGRLLLPPLLKLLPAQPQDSVSLRPPC